MTSDEKELADSLHFYHHNHLLWVARILSTLYTQFQVRCITYMTVYDRSFIMSFRQHLPCLLSGGTTTGSDTGLGRLTPAVLYVHTLKKWVRPDCNLSMTWVVSLTKDIASVHNEDSVDRTYSSPHFTI